ncbi:MAG: class I SAM-dependent methyltransferase [Clostridia bacterium]|nr:class I SAM-dependent methyltransferase [Clostridia bacterium]
MSAYSILAKYYDRLMGDFDYTGYLKFVEDGLKGEGVDLACGSGEMTIALAKSGRKMTGIDISGEMLNLATVKAKKEGVDVKWIKQDIADLELSHKVDFVTCVCDGVNYIEKTRLKDFFDRVNTYLKEGGEFVFDISSSYKLSKILADNLFCEDYDDLTYIWSNTLGEGFVDMDLDFFEKIQGDTYKRVGESHRQYIHTQNDIEEVLRDWDVKVYDGETFSNVKPKSKRLLFVATKK